MDKTDKIYIAGHTGLVGSALVRALHKQGYTNILTRTHKECDLTNPNSVGDLFFSKRPAYVFLAAAKVGGILANYKKPADFFYHNLMIQTNIINAAVKYRVKKLLFLGSSCIYPKYCEQPIKEECLMTGSLETTNKAYATAKIAGIEYCQACNEQYNTHFITAIPCNLYGPFDNYDLHISHVLPALIRKMYEAKENRAERVIVWGDGSAEREFLYVDDLAEACIYLMNTNPPDIINIGSGRDLTIAKLASMIKQIIGYEGKISWDYTKPNGTPKKLLNISKINSLGWYAKTSLMEGLRLTYQSFLNEIKYGN